MSLAGAESYLKQARQTASQQDINTCLMNAIYELMAELKHVGDEARKARREVRKDWIR